MRDGRVLRVLQVHLTRALTKIIMAARPLLGGCYLYVHHVAGTDLSLLEALEF